MAFAAKSKVPVDQTRLEIERLLKKYGAANFAYFSESNRAIIAFEANDRRIRFDLPLPDDLEKHAQARRSKWRALLLCIKAKLESVESKIETFEQAFYANVVMPNGMTLYEATHDQVAVAVTTGKMVPLLPAPPGKKP